MSYSLCNLRANGSKTVEQTSTTETMSLCLGSPSSSLLIPIQPADGDIVHDVRQYLATRSPVPLFEMERHLFQKLPLELRNEVRELQRAVLFVRNLITGKDRIKVQPACITCLNIYTHFKLTTFRAKFDVWLKQQDWLVLVNRAKAGPEWQACQRGLSDAFLDYVASRMGAGFTRGDAGEQAILSIHRQWQTGRNQHGESESIPGYEQNWELRNRNILPEGWSSTNIRQQLKKRAALTKAQKALLHEGIASCKAFIPHVHSTRAGLRFMELVQYDDVRCDFRVIDVESGQICDLWLLVARDVATGMLLGFGMRPARARDDGTQEHLKLQDMKQLFGWVLETYGLAPYKMTHKIENGTATLAEAVRLAIIENIGEDHIDISYASMISGKSAVGYQERAVGNSQGKAMLESLNRLMHMIASSSPGQIGANYSKRPADLAAREREAINIWESHRPEDRQDLSYPFYTLSQARRKLFEVFHIQNNRTEHDMEGFERIAEWYDQNTGTWMPQHIAPRDMTNVRVRTRMESPIERAKRLVAGSPGFTRVPAEALVAFYEHSQRKCVVKDKGEIEFMHEGVILHFAPPTADHALAPETKCLAYFNPNDPRFITLTDGRGSILGTWVRRNLVRHGDQDALAQAIRYSQGALKADKERARELAAPEIARLDAMRQHNAGFMTVIDGSTTAQAKKIESKTVSAHLAEMATNSKRETAEREKALRNFDADMSDLLSPNPSPASISPDIEFSAEELL